MLFVIEVLDNTAYDHGLSDFTRVSHSTGGRLSRHAIKHLGLRVDHLLIVGSIGC